tara:strand:- start:29 stop:640 length:612 start_codon:yes stop_codon:yes gene_type:complete
LSSKEGINSEYFILASGSEIRKKILSEEGFNFIVETSMIDEESLKKEITSLSFQSKAIALAEAKAKEVSKKNLNIYVVGADQLCVCDNKIYNKPGNKEKALKNLNALSGKVHHQYSGISICLEGNVIWSFCDISSLTMKKLSNEELLSYIQKDKPYSCAGSYKYESYGADLFSKVNGSKFSILGLALNPLMSAFDELKISFKK